MATQQDPRKVNTKLQQAIQAILTDRPIAYHAVLAKAVGSATAGILISQLLYWTPRSQDKEGWIYKTQKDIYEETALTRREQESARRMLRAARVLEEKRAGVPSRLYFRVDMEYLTRLLSQGGDEWQGNNSTHQPDEPDQTDSPHDVQNVHRTMAQTAIQEWRKRANKNGGNVQTLIGTETTTETTTESDDDVCAELEKFGVSKKTAERLAKNYPQENVFEKLELVQWLVDTKSPLVSKNPQGFLIKAIEDGYLPQPPKEYKSASMRKEEEETQKLELEQQRRAEEQFQKAREEAKQRVLEQHPPQPIENTELTTESTWSRALAQMRQQVPAATYSTWLKDTLLLQLEGDTAFILVSSRFARDWLNRRLYGSISRTLEHILDRAVEIEFVVGPPSEEMIPTGPSP